MADKKISELVSLAGKDVAATDLFPVVDVNVAEIKSLTRDELRNAVNAIQFTATKALATTAAASLPDDTIIEVAADESLSGARTRYTVASGALVFAVNWSAITPLQQDALNAKANAQSTDLTNVSSIVYPNAANEANPNIVDVATSGDASPALTSTANQLCRQRNNTTGVLSAYLPAAVGSFAETRKYDVVAGQTYTVSMHGAPSNFIFYFSGTVQLLTFTSAGVLGTKITSLTRSYGDREVTFTVPVGSTKISFTVRNSVDFSNTVPMTETALQYCLDNIMLNAGSSSAYFAPFTGGVFSPASTIFNPARTNKITVARQGTDYYVRAPAQQSPTYDVVWQVKVNTDSGVNDFYGVRFISKSAPSSSTIQEFNKSTLRQCAGYDESCPIRLNQMYLAGGHGVTCYTVTKAAHGKTAVDVGQLVTDGTAQWVLYSIPTSGTLVYVRKNTTATDKWTITSAAPASSTFTYVSGGVDTSNVAFTAPTQGQFRPVIRSYLREMRVDNVAVTADGVYSGDRVVLAEVYSLMNVASQQDYLIAHAGGTPDYTNAAITEQVRFFYEFEWNKFGAVSIRAGYGVKDAFRRDAGNGYWGALQIQRLSLVGDSTVGMHNSVWLYAPDIAAVGAYDFQAIANITANATEIRLPKASCANTSDPASHFAMIGKDAGGTILSGHLFGYSRSEGQGIPATRAASVVDCLFLSSSEKMYPIAIDSAAGDAAANDVVAATAFRAPFLPTDPTLTVPAVVVDMSGEKFIYITSHQNHTNKTVSIDTSLNGRKLAVVKGHANFALNNEYVSAGGFSISVINGYADAILKVL